MAKPLIFVVDDERPITRIVQVNLERAGYSISIAYDGQEALTALQSGKVCPDMILMDVTMPYMDGFELLERIKADENLKQIPVVMMTARTRDADIVEGQARGASRYLAKPVSIPELISVVKITLGEETESV